MYYFVLKKEYAGDILFLDNITGYKFTPKNKINGGIIVDEMTIVKPDFIKTILKRKVRLMLETLDDESDSDSSDDSRKALDHIQRYKKLINEKYSKFLDKKYISLLNQKIDILEREFKNNLFYQYEIENQNNIEEYEIEENKNRRSR